MVIDHDIVGITVRKQVIPVLWIVPEGIMEHKLEMWGFLTHEVTNVAVEQFERPLVRLGPRLVHRLDGIQRRVITPAVNNAVDGVLSPKKVVEIDKVV